jgi:hypothetical protein
MVAPATAPAINSNAWVHQMNIALMIDPQGDSEIIKAHARVARRSVICSRWSCTTIRRTDAALVGKMELRLLCRQFGSNPHE